MNRQQRLFSREMIRQVNQNMIDRKPVDMSGLPVSVAQSIRAEKFTRDEIKRAFAEAHHRVVA